MALTRRQLCRNSPLGTAARHPAPTFAPWGPEWDAAATLSLRGAIRVGAIAEQDRGFAEFVNGRLVPLVRLSRERLLAPGARG